MVPRAIEIQGATVPVRTHVRLTADDIQRVQGLPVTSAAFTVCDLAARTGVAKLSQVADQLIAEDRLSLDGLHEMVARFRAIEGVERLRRVLEELSPAVAMEPVRGRARLVPDLASHAGCRHPS